MKDMKELKSFSCAKTVKANKSEAQRTQRFKKSQKTPHGVVYPELKCHLFARNRSQTEKKSTRWMPALSILIHPAGVVSAMCLAEVQFVRKW